MKKLIIPIMLTACILAGCNTKAPAAPEATQPAAETAAPAQAPAVVMPIADNTMENLDNCIISVELPEGAVSATDAGTLMMLQIYTYDQYDMVDIAQLEPGDIIVMEGVEVAVTSVDRNDSGTVLVNGGLDEGGFDLCTDDSGIFYAQGYSDMKSWRYAGSSDFLLADNFCFTDSSDLELGAVTYTAEDLLNGNPDISTGFLPQNTTVRIENGMIVEMNRVYTP